MEGSLFIRTSPVLAISDSHDMTKVPELVLLSEKKEL